MKTITDSDDTSSSSSLHYDDSLSDSSDTSTSYDSEK